METWNNAGTPLQLGRFPYDNEERGLRAWNGADTLLTEHVQTFASGKSLKILILNDTFGALACRTIQMGHEVHSQTDSFLSRLACAENLKRNKLDPSKLIFIDSLTAPAFSTWSPDLILMQIPKSNLLLEFQLELLSRTCTAGVPFCAGAMTRDVHNSTSQFFEKIIGPTHTSLASYKARLIHSVFTSVQPKSNVVWPRKEPLNEQNLPSVELLNHAGVFSASGHDKGSLFLLRCLSNEILPIEASHSCIIDCGCGNGLLALVAANLFPSSSLVCVDESFMAIESARAGFAHNGMSDRASFVWTDCLNGIESSSADLILCNPPFHQGPGQSQTLAIAQRMFEQSRRCLKNSGKLLVVANRHLGHHRYLETLFPHMRIVRENDQFMVIEATLE